MNHWITFRLLKPKELIFLLWNILVRNAIIIKCSGGQDRQDPVMSLRQDSINVLIAVTLGENIVD